MTNPLQKLQEYGQSIWLDYIDRNLMQSGELERLIAEDGVKGVTSNPTIFQKAITNSQDYDQDLAHLIRKNPHISPLEIYEELVVQDIQMACDILLPVYESTNQKDGFVSLEVSPHLAYNKEKTIQETKRLWNKVDRPNLMIKIPATLEGIQAIEESIAEGIHINVTLIFSIAHYKATAHAYLNGVKRCKKKDRVNSVASFFVSRIDSAIDPLLEKEASSLALSLQGKIAIANAKLAYQEFRKIFFSDSFQKFQEGGVKIQRPLWASTSTKNPNYKDVLYVENLIGPETVNTLPPTTLQAFRDHGIPALTIEENIQECEKQLHCLEKLGIHLDEVCNNLQQAGVQAFIHSFDKLIASLEEKCAHLDTR